MSISTSLQFTSDSGTSASESRTSAQRREGILNEVIRTPIVRFLSPDERMRDEDVLRDVEEEREERERDEGELMDLEPLPSRDADTRERQSGHGDLLARVSTSSEEPLLISTPRNEAVPRDSMSDNIDV
jgi:hypothetical protein